MSVRHGVAYGLAVLLGACGACEDGGGRFFEPEQFGTYVFDPAPDIVVPPILDFGEVGIGTRARRDLEIGNVGREPLIVDAISTSHPAFTVSTMPLDTEAILFRESRRLDVDFIAADRDPVHELLRIDSNDPDEGVVNVILLANRNQPCAGSFEVGQPLWQVHTGEGPACWPSRSASHGDVAEYQYADVPPADDPGWVMEPDRHISFERRSSLCGTDCACRGGGDFTYFQAFVYVPDGARVRRYGVDIHDVDDGARVSVFNDRYPDGVTDPDSYARIPGGSSANLAPYLDRGMNRVVITHIDDCCSISRIRNVVVTVDGEELEGCAN